MHLYSVVNFIGTSLSMCIKVSLRQQVVICRMWSDTQMVQNQNLVNLIAGGTMFAANQIHKKIRLQPESDIAQIFSRLIVSLESDEPLKLQEIYSMPFDDFKLAIEIIRDWRVERYYKSKMKVLDTSVHHQENKVGG